MSTFQKITIVGNLGDNPITHHFDGGGQITRFSVATTEHWKDKTTGERKELTEWHRVIANGKTGELCEKYLHKGSKVLIEGKLRTRKWKNDTGVEQYTTEVIAREVVFMSPKSDSVTNQGSAVDQYQAKSKDAREENFDDLPF